MRRQVDCTAGRVLLDGRDVATVGLALLRSWRHSCDLEQSAGAISLSRATRFFPSVCL